jgi:hypothetical protein
VKLNDRQIAIAKAMLARGDRQHDVAALFGVNAGRIAELATGKVGKDIDPAGGRLPPPTLSPYELRHAANKAADDLGVQISGLIALLDGLGAIRAALVAVTSALPKSRKPSP